MRDFWCEVCGKTATYNLDPRKAELWRPVDFNWPETEDYPSLYRQIMTCPKCAEMSDDDILRGFQARVKAGAHPGFL
jgi:hypothetical protein